MSLFIHKTIPFIYLGFLFITLLLSCQISQEYGSNPTTLSAEQQLLNKVISHYGGIEAYQNLESFSYRKDFDLLDSSGAIEKSYRQQHWYNKKDNYYKVHSIESGDTIVSILSQGNYSRTKNGEPTDAPAASIKRSINSSVYAINSPFNLLDKNVRLQCLDKAIKAGDTLEVLEARYNAKTYENHSSSEPWRYYIKNNGEIAYCWIKSSDHFNYVYNLSTQDLNQVKMHHERKSFRVDSLGKELYLRAEYRYYDFKITP